METTSALQDDGNKILDLKTSMTSMTRRSSGGGMIRFQGHRIPQSVDLADKREKPMTRTTSTSMDDSVDTTSGRFLFDDMDGSTSIGSLTETSRYSSIRRVLGLVKSRKSRWSLRTQLLVPFGLLSSLTIGFIIFAAVGATLRASDNILESGRSSVDKWATHKLAWTSRYKGDIITQKLYKLEGLLSLIQLATQDRFAGYPDVIDDRHVPFPNHFDPSSTKYPWKARELLPLPTNIAPNVNETNAGEHTGKERFGWYREGIVSTADAMFVPSDATHNGPKTVTEENIHRKASDYASPLLKSLFEHHREVKSVEIHFINDGYAGASIVFPGLPNWTLYSDGDQNSIGCEWLRLPNPFDSTRPLLNFSQRSHCAESSSSAAGSILKQDFCRQQALFPDQHRMEGPFWHEGRWTVRFGKAIFDSLTDELIACTSVMVDAATLGFVEIDSSFRLLNEWEGFQALVRWDDLGGAVMSPLLSEGETLDGAGQVQTSVPLYAKDLNIGLNDDGNSFLEQSKQRFLDEYIANGTISETAVVHQGRYLTVYPSPPPHNNTQKVWEPLFLNIVSLSLQARDDHLVSLREQLDPHTSKLIRAILIAGFVSLAAILLVIYVVSLFLTLPLEWMNDIGKQILKSAGEVDAGDHNEGESHGLSTSSLNLGHTPWWYKVSPRTEVIQLVAQFNQMVKQFSGHGTAKLFKQQLLEVKNPFNLQKNFQQLYGRRQQSRGSYVYPRAQLPLADPGMTPSASSNLCIENRLYEGPNVHAMEDDHSASIFRFADDPSTSTAAAKQRMLRRAVMRSPLFWWIVCSIALPLVFCLTAIAGYVIYDISQTFPTLVDIAGEVYTGLERDFLVPFARLRATYISEIVSTTLRDLHLFNRAAGWLYLGGLQLTQNTFVEMNMVAETCKAPVALSGFCPEYASLSAQCDCAWNDPWRIPCQPMNSSRRLQIPSFEGLSNDAFPNGDRNHTSFPALATTPLTTNFYPDMESLPGYNTSSTSMLDTTFSRARVAASLAIIEVPLYNYGAKTYYPIQRTFGSYVTMEKSGSISGYAGCNHYLAFAAAFSLPSWNKRLCPPGQFGMDPRCLEWYVLCQEKALDASKAPLYVTPPVKIPPNPAIPTTLSLPLVDTRKDEFLGVSILRYTEEPIIQILSDRLTPLGFGSFHLMTVAGEHAKPDGSLVIGPGFSFGDTPLPISAVMLPHDTCNSTINSTESCANIEEFDDIVADMHNGGTSLKTFLRTSNVTGRLESISLTYAPVRVRSYRPIDPADFSRGIKEYTSDIFSVALGQTEEGLAQTFASSEEALTNTLRRFVLILIAIALSALVFLIPVSAWISFSTIVPVTQLCKLVTDINRNQTNSEFPEVTGGSLEVSRVRSTFYRLYKLIRVGNMAFFLGELDRAYDSLKDALALFTKLNNRKAIGIANNNLGNLMLTMYRTMMKTGAPVMYDLSRQKVVQRGCAYFKTAVDLGEEALKKINDKEGFSVNYLIFMQQVSNRYFNRALFLLSIHKDRYSPSNAYEQGIMDLTTCRDMDREVVDNGDHVGFKGDKEVYFELLMGRIKGILMLLKLGYDDSWGIDDLFEEARAELVSALETYSHEGHPLFDELDPAGQMQRLDSTLIDYHLYMAEQAPSENQDEK